MRELFRCHVGAAAAVPTEILECVGQSKIGNKHMEVHAFAIFGHTHARKVIKEHVSRLQVLVSENSVLTGQSKSPDNLN